MPDDNLMPSRPGMNELLRAALGPPGDDDPDTARLARLVASPKAAPPGATSEQMSEALRSLGTTAGNPAEAIRLGREAQVRRTT